MSKFVKLVVPVTWQGMDVAAGEVIEVNDQSAEALIRDGAAAEYKAKSEEGSGPADGAENPGHEVGESGAPDHATPDPALTIEMDKKALDAQYKADELKKAAKDVGVEFPYDANKGAVIEAIIEAGKAALLLK